MKATVLVVAAALVVVGWGMQRTGHVAGVTVSLAAVALAVLAWAFL